MFYFTYISQEHERITHLKTFSAQVHLEFMLNYLRNFLFHLLFLIFVFHFIFNVNKLNPKSILLKLISNNSHSYP